MVFFMILILVVLPLCRGALQAPSVKVVAGGFGSGGQWLDSGNRLPDDWTPLPFGQCRAESTTPALIQAVGYGGDGTTCNFQSYPLDVQSPLISDGYIIAAGTDVYMGFHFPDDFSQTPRAPQWGPCDFNNGQNFQEGNSRRMCAQGCGECYEVTGPAGKWTFLVNEVADINLPDGLGNQGVKMILGNGQGRNGQTQGCRGANGQLDPGECLLKVVDYQGPSVVSVKKVPCPLGGDMNMKLGVHGFNAEPLNGFNVELVVLNHRVGLTDLWVRGRDANDQPTVPWRWVPRGWTNRFDLFPSNGLDKFIFELSPSKTFDVKLRPTVGADLICTATWNPTPTPSDPSFGVVSLGNCQFPDVAVDPASCNVPFPPNPLVSEQVYSRSDNIDCPSLNSQPGGCNVKTEGPYLAEWRHWAAFGLSGGMPNYGFTGDCHTGQKCIDSTVAVGTGGFMIGWVQRISTSMYPALSSVRYWAKCISGASCKITLSIESAVCNGAGLTSPEATVGNAWQEVQVELAPLLANCPSGLQWFKWVFPQGTQFLMDDVGLFCGNALCANSPPVAPLPTTTTTTTTVAANNLETTTTTTTTAAANNVGTTTTTTANNVASTDPAASTNSPTTTTTTTTTTNSNNNNNNNGGTSTTTTSTSSVSSSSPGAKVPCVFSTSALPANHLRMLLRLDLNFAEFVCPDFVQQLLAELKGQPSDLLIYSCVSGSVILEFSSLSLSVSNFATSIQNGASKLPIQSATFNGAVIVPPSSGLAWWIILLIVIGALILILGIILLIVYLRSRRNDSALAYFKLPESGLGVKKTYAAPYREEPRFSLNAEVAPNNSSYRFRLKYSVVDDGPSILKVDQGSCVFVQIADLNTPGEWVWAMDEKTRKENYVPRAYLIPADK